MQSENILDANDDFFSFWVCFYLTVRHKQVMNKSLTTHEQLMNKSQTKCEQVVNK